MSFLTFLVTLFIDENSTVDWKYGILFKYFYFLIFFNLNIMKVIEKTDKKVDNMKYNETLKNICFRWFDRECKE